MAMKAKGQTTFMRATTRAKYKRLAALDRRTLLDTFDIVADSELERRGLVTKSGKPSKQRKS